MFGFKSVVNSRVYQGVSISNSCWPDLTNRMFQGGLQADDFQELFRSLGLEGPEFLGISKSEDIFGRFFSMRFLGWDGFWSYEIRIPTLVYRYRGKFMPNFSIVFLKKKNANHFLLGGSFPTQATLPCGRPWIWWTPRGRKMLVWIRWLR